MSGVHSVDRVWERKAFGAERKDHMQMLRGKVLGTFSEQFSACCALKHRQAGYERDVDQGDETMGELTKGLRQEEKIH